MTIPLADGRKLIAQLMSGSLRPVRGLVDTYESLSGVVKVDCRDFESPLHTAIVAAITAGIEVGDMRISNDLIVEVCTNIGDDPVAIRGELNKVGPFRWRNPRTAAGLGRLVTT